MLRSRYHILFGHASPFRCSSEEEGGVQRRSADVDFSDVFGGPPRTSPGFEGRHGFSESVDAYLSRVRGEGVEGGGEVAAPPRRWSTSYVEKPGDGGTGSPGHRRHLTNVGDIFKDSESASSSPRRTDGPSASSASSAAVLSPAHPPRPTIDGLSGGSSLAAQIRFLLSSILLHWFMSRPCEFCRRWSSVVASIGGINSFFCFIIIEYQRR